MSRRAWIAFAAVSMIWGIPYLFIRIAVRGGVTPLALAWGRLALAAIVLVALAWRAGTLSHARGLWRWLIAYAIAEVTIPFPLIAFGEQHVASSLAAIVIAAVPLIGAVLAMRFDHSERPTPLRAFGLLIGFAGVIALVGIDVAGRPDELLGIGAILLAAVGYSIGPMIIKHRLGGLDARATIGSSLGIAAVVLTPLALLDLPRRAPRRRGDRQRRRARPRLHRGGVRDPHRPDPRGRDEPSDGDHVHQSGDRGRARRRAARRAARRGRGRGPVADPGRLVAVDRRPVAAPVQQLAAAGMACGRRAARRRDARRSGPTVERPARVDAATGAVVWQRSVGAAIPSGPPPQPNALPCGHGDGTNASSIHYVLAGFALADGAPAPVDAAGNVLHDEHTFVARGGRPHVQVEAAKAPTGALHARPRRVRRRRPPVAHPRDWRSQLAGRLAAGGQDAPRRGRIGRQERAYSHP